MSEEEQGEVSEGQEDWWNTPLEDLANEMLGLSSKAIATGNQTRALRAQRRMETMTILLQARATLQAARDTKRLVWATWALVGATGILALVAILAG
jgi:hypothetical protein